MDFTYYPTIPASEINPLDLQHRYFVQLAPDGSHLVPGQLQQDIKPDVGQWLEIGHIARDFPARYFVQYTDFNTLVPGSVIQADRFPQGNWKEIKKPPFTLFRRVVFNPEFTASIHSDHAGETFATYASSVVWFTMSVLNYFQPGVYSDTQPASLQLFSFHGSFADLDNDVSKLKVFGNVDSDFTLYDAVHNTNTSLLTTNQSFSGFDYVKTRPFAPDGYFSLVVKIAAHADTPAYYIVMENLFNRYDFPYD